MSAVKEEPNDGPEGLVPRIKVEPPLGFEPDEWEKLTNGFACEKDEIDAILDQRGAGGSRKGRPLNSTVPYKGPLSSSSRAVAQRERKAQFDKEEKALESTRSADRAAKYQLKKQYLSDPDYTSASKRRQEEILLAAYESLASRRFEQMKSAEWLETNLTLVHKKWHDITKEIDMRKHKKTLEGILGTEEGEPRKELQGRGMQRVFGPGGALQNILRNTYSEGLLKLNTNTFESSEAKKEFEEFVEGLTAEELQLVTDDEWQREEPTSVFDLLGDADIELEGDMPYVKGDDSDECEEEVDDDSDIDEHFRLLENEYEDDEQWAAAQKEAQLSEESEFEGFSDSE
ncbi:hypothetical protein CFE70_001394 [Pyrenophora teres f. teres 0-1]|nr:hypothetical protein HRS9139_01243 [Pyrenophora teres f. teres]